MENLMNTYNPTFHQKVNYLINSLTNIKNVMDEVACEIDDLNLKSALSGIASESCRYISELFIECNKFGLPVKKNDFTLIPAFEDYNFSLSPKEELLYIFEKNENKLSIAYANLLEEPHPFIHLKELVNYQFLSLKSAFSKLKLLNSSRFISRSVRWFI